MDRTKYDLFNEIHVPADEVIKKSLERIHACESFGDFINNELDLASSAAWKGDGILDAEKPINCSKHCFERGFAVGYARALLIAESAYAHLIFAKGKE